MSGEAWLSLEEPRFFEWRGVTQSRGGGAFLVEWRVVSPSGYACASSAELRGVSMIASRAERSRGGGGVKRRKWEEVTGSGKRAQNSGELKFVFFTDIHRHAYCLYSAQVSATLLSPFRRYTIFCCVYSMVYDLRNGVRNSTQK